MGPTLLFFIAFFIAFSLLELILIWLLNRWATRHAVFVIDQLMRFELHHRGLIRWLAYGSILLLILFILYTTSLWEVLRAATPEIRWFSLGLLLVMILIYFVMTRKATRMALERRVHQYLYVMISLFLYAMIVLLASQTYQAYQELVNTQLINPALRQVKQTLDQQEKERLLTTFRAMIGRGECPEMDYRQKGGTGLIQFVFVTLDTDLFAPDYADGTDLTAELSGRACTDGKETFLLKDDGSWYWVIAG